MSRRPRLVSGHRERDHRAQRHPAKMPAARRPALASAANANTPATVTTIQCRAGSDAIEGAASKQHAAADPGHGAGLPHQPDQGAQRGPARWWRAANTLVSPSTPWIRATAIAATPAHCRKISRIGVLHTVLYGLWRCAGACQYSSVWWMSQENMADQLSAKDWLDQGLRALAEKRFYGAESRTAGEGDGGFARQLLLAFRRYRRVPCRDPQALARDRRRADHRRPEAASGRRRSAAAAAAPGVRRQSWRWRTRSAPGPRSIPAARSRRAGHRPAPAGLCENSSRAGLHRNIGPCPGANSLLGVSRLCAVGQAVAAGGTPTILEELLRIASSNAPAPFNHTLHRSSNAGDQPMTASPERLEAPSIRNCSKFGLPADQGPAGVRRGTAGADFTFSKTRLSDPRLDSDLLPEEARKIE